MRRIVIRCLPAVLLAVASFSRTAEPLPVVTEVELQPLAAATRRVVQALELVGSPLDKQQQAAIEKALAGTNGAEAAEQVQAVLDPLCLVGVNINPESRVKVTPGPAPRKLLQQGHRVFLVKVHNEGGVTAQLHVASPNAEPLVKHPAAVPIRRSRSNRTKFPTAGSTWRCSMASRSTKHSRACRSNTELSSSTAATLAAARPS